MTTENLAKFLLFLAVAAVSTTTWAQTKPPTASNTPRAEVAFAYNYLRSNAPPGDCQCFNLNGGGVSFALPLESGKFALVAEFTAVHAGSVSSNNYDLTLTTYAFGGRYRLLKPSSPWQPYAQALVGVAHASGSLVDNTTASNAGASLMAKFGGGVDLHLSQRFSWRLFEASYLPTTINNGSNNHQNNLRIATGLVWTIR